MALEDKSSRVDHDAPKMIWRQVADDIRREIDEGTLTPGARLPSGPDLAQQYGVSRVTVQRVVRELVAEGVLVVVTGRGTYVRPRES